MTLIISIQFTHRFVYTNTLLTNMNDKKIKSGQNMRWWRWIIFFIFSIVWMQLFTDFHLFLGHCSAQKCKIVWNHIPNYPQQIFGCLAKNEHGSNTSLIFLCDTGANEIENCGASRAAYRPHFIQSHVNNSKLFERMKGKNAWERACERERERKCDIESE